MREIYLVSQDFIKGHIFYDGPKIEKHRKDFERLDELLDALPGCINGYNPKKPIEVHFEGYTSEQRKSIQLVLYRKLPKAKYPKN